MCGPILASDGLESDIWVVRGIKLNCWKRAFLVLQVVEIEKISWINSVWEWNGNVGVDGQ